MEYDYYPGEWLERVAVNREALTVAELRVLLEDVSEQGDWPVVVLIPESTGYVTAYPVGVEVLNEKLVLRAQLSDSNEADRRDGGREGAIVAREWHEPNGEDA